ncbi:hypothetical protein AN958_08847 [Leucoagaricus sp. SymC.cos]|nr:hypothetical protein AN958_08847 [Leucoagaricus sp. SymC.cos]
MASLSVSASFDSRLSSPGSPGSYVTVPPSPASAFNQPSPASSNFSLDPDDDENATITIKQGVRSGELDDLRLLAISTHMTELSYSISDIQARIFEIQELRHKSHSSSDNANTSSIIDQSLAAMDEKLQLVEKGIKSVTETLDPLLKASTTPTISSVTGEPNDRAAVLRKHAALIADWEALQKETQVLREELKEDKWLTVFRTVTDQADGMMSSLEKAVNRCQDFIWQVHRRGVGAAEELNSMSQTSLVSSGRGDGRAVTFEVFTSLLESYEAKKKHYMPATSKVLAIIDKGVQERVTKNGETLRRHAESAQRWRNLRERISRTDAEMENVRRIFLSGGDASSEAGSSTSGQLSSKNGYLATPQSAPRMSRAPSAASTISESISPLRMFARKLAGGSRPSSSSVTPLSVNKGKMSRTPSSEPLPNTKKSQRASMFSSVRRDDPKPLPLTPERPSHKYSKSMTPESSPRALPKLETGSVGRGRGPARPSWNSSTKVEPESRTVKATLPKRSPSATGQYAEDSPTGMLPFRSLAVRSQTPEIGTLRARPLYGSVSGGLSGQKSTISRPSLPRAPPSSFRDGSNSRAPSRPGSRAGAHTPATAMLIESWAQNSVPVHEYIPVDLKDALDVEVATILNSLGHGFKVERSEAPLRRPKPGEEVTAKYRFSTTLGSKNVTLKLTTMNRRGGAEGSVTVKKVMCRVGGGWQDLSDYVLNRQL